MTKNIKRLLITLLVIVCHTTFGTAQTITGTVTEIFGGVKEPIMRANVVLVNNQNRHVGGTVTDMNGNYILQVPKDAKNLKLQVSYIGMQTQSVKYTGQKILNFTLQAQATLKEVTVTGQKGGRDGMGISRMEQTASVQRIDLTEIVETSPVTSVEEALQGQIAGLDINLGGDPGARSSIRIRGTSSLSASN